MPKAEVQGLVGTPARGRDLEGPPLAPHGQPGPDGAVLGAEEAGEPIPPGGARILQGGGCGGHGGAHSPPNARRNSCSFMGLKSGESFGLDLPLSTGLVAGTIGISGPITLSTFS